MSVADLYWAYRTACDPDFRTAIAESLKDGEYTFDGFDMTAALRSALVDAVCVEGADAVRRARRIEEARKRRGE